ncbi:hypothetical protein [Streptomyces sp. NPDC021096]|uniref:hypothetical protein n=1 Tax=Streptomyces sp. NPDC021096 TaxID=3154792 RepID=UPI0033EE36AA
MADFGLAIDRRATRSTSIKPAHSPAIAANPPKPSTSPLSEEDGHLAALIDN